MKCEPYDENKFSADLPFQTERFKNTLLGFIIQLFSETQRLTPYVRKDGVAISVPLVISPI